MKKVLILIACITFVCSCKPDDDYSSVQPDDGAIEQIVEGYC